MENFFFIGYIENSVQKIFLIFLIILIIFFFFFIYFFLFNFYLILQGCTYANQASLDNLVLRKNSSFHWLIPDTADTTNTNTICAYDRFFFKIFFNYNFFFYLLMDKNKNLLCSFEIFFFDQLGLWSILGAWSECLFLNKIN